jgi:hypothetical protein
VIHLQRHARESAPTMNDESLSSKLNDQDAEALRHRLLLRQQPGIDAHDTRTYRHDLCRTRRHLLHELWSANYGSLLVDTRAPSSSRGSAPASDSAIARSSHLRSPWQSNTSLSKGWGFSGISPNSSPGSRTSRGSQSTAQLFWIRRLSLCLPGSRSCRIWRSSRSRTSNLAPRTRCACF